MPLPITEIMVHHVHNLLFYFGSHFRVHLQYMKRYIGINQIYVTKEPKKSNCKSFCVKKKVWVTLFIHTIGIGWGLQFLPYISKDRTHSQIKQTKRISLRSPLYLEKAKHRARKEGRETKQWHWECGLLLQQMLSSFLLLFPSLISLLSPSLDASPQVFVIVVVVCYIAPFWNCWWMSLLFFFSVGGIEVCKFTRVG